MNEITLVELLNKICEKNKSLTWKLTCKYANNMGETWMEILIYYIHENRNKGTIIFGMERGTVSQARYTGMGALIPGTQITDVLLDILYYEGNTSSSIAAN